MLYEMMMMVVMMIVVVVVVMMMMVTVGDPCSSRVRCDRHRRAGAADKVSISQRASS